MSAKSQGNSFYKPIDPRAIQTFDRHDTHCIVEFTAMAREAKNAGATIPVSDLMHLTIPGLVGPFLRPNMATIGAIPYRYRLTVTG